MRAALHARVSTDKQAEKYGIPGQIEALREKISIGLDNLDFTGKQELLRLLVEKVFYNGQSVEILTIIPLGE